MDGVSFLAGNGRAILAVQNAFGPRIDRILGSGGGLLVVTDRVDDEADRTAAALSSSQVPVALIDPRTLSGLRRLGAASSVAEVGTLYETAPQAAEPRLLRQAREKLRGAVALAQGAESVPDTMVRELAADVSLFVVDETAVG